MEKSVSTSFGKLKELYSDLSKVEKMNSFGVKTVKKKKEPFYLRAKGHLKQHKWKYATVLGNAVVLTVLKNRLNRTLNREHEKKVERRNEENMRKIFQQELNNYHNTYHN